MPDPLCRSCWSLVCLFAACLILPGPAAADTPIGVPADRAYRSSPGLGEEFDVRVGDLFYRRESHSTVKSVLLTDRDAIESLFGGSKQSLRLAQWRIGGVTHYCGEFGGTPALNLTVGDQAFCLRDDDDDGRVTSLHIGTFPFEAWEREAPLADVPVTAAPAVIQWREFDGFFGLRLRNLDGHKAGVQLVADGLERRLVGFMTKDNQPIPDESMPYLWLPRLVRGKRISFGGADFLIVEIEPDRVRLRLLADFDPWWKPVMRGGRIGFDDSFVLGIAKQAKASTEPAKKSSPVVFDLKSEDENRMKVRYHDLRIERSGSTDPSDPQAWTPGRALPGGAPLYRESATLVYRRTGVGEALNIAIGGREFGLSPDLWMSEMQIGDRPAHCLPTTLGAGWEYDDEAHGFRSLCLLDADDDGRAESYAFAKPGEPVGEIAGLPAEVPLVTVRELDWPVQSLTIELAKLTEEKASLHLVSANPRFGDRGRDVIAGFELSKDELPAGADALGVLILVEQPWDPSAGLDFKIRGSFAPWAELVDNNTTFQASYSLSAGGDGEEQ